MKKSILSLSLLAAGTLLASTHAMAQYTVQLGAIYLDPNSAAGTTTGPLTPVGALSLTVKPQTTLFFSVARDITEHVDVQLSLGYPPEHDVVLKIVDATPLPASVAAQNGVLVSRTRQIAPTLFANYKFGSADSKFRPFVGVGVNYTKFEPTESTAANDAISGGKTNISMTDSWGLAWQAGAAYKFDKNWSISGTYATAHVNSTITTNTLGVVRNLDVSFRPITFTVAVGYSF